MKRFKILFLSLMLGLCASPTSGQGNPASPTRLPRPAVVPPPPPPAPVSVQGPVLNEVPGTAIPEMWSEEFGLAPVTQQPQGPASATQSIGSALSTEAQVESPPLQKEVVKWYQVPWRWMSKGWSNHAEFGLDGSRGNADTLAIQTGLEMKRKTDVYTLALDIDYRNATASDRTTEDNGRLNIDYDRLLGDSSWTLFGKFGLEFDEFKVFDLRANVNGGLGYYWIRNDNTNLITRFGAGANREIGSPDDEWKQEAVFGIEADHQLSGRQKIKGKVDYFPEWADFDNYRMVADVAWESLLDSTDNLSIRLSLTNRYDSTPQGALPNDVYYSALLLYKF